MKSRGFTLLEVMMALAVLALAISALVAFQGRGIVMNSKARDLTTATTLARQKMEEIKLQVDKDLRLGKFSDGKTEEGAFETPFDRYKWKFELKKVELPIPPESGDNQKGGSSIMTTIVNMISKQLSDSVREAKLTILWEELDKERQFSVTTHFVKN